MQVHVILYVADQKRARDFYAAVFDQPPKLDVPGMTEFTLGPDYVLGLMPAAGIRRLLGDTLPDPDRAAGIPRCELYLVVGDAAQSHARALRAGATELSPLAGRDWGHRAAYSL